MRRLSALLQQLFANQLDPERLGHHQALWRRSVDPAVADHTMIFVTPTGRCIIYADSPAWASAVRSRRDTLLAKLQTQGLAISELRVLVTPAEHSAPRTARRAIPAPQAADGFAELAARTGDDELAAALMRLAHTLRQR